MKINPDFPLWDYGLRKPRLDFINKKIKEL